MVTLTGSTDDADIAHPDRVQPPVAALQRSLVSESLLRTAGRLAIAGPSH
jgi:hypothetical protein